MFFFVGGGFVKKAVEKHTDCKHTDFNQEEKGTYTYNVFRNLDASEVGNKNRMLGFCTRPRAAGAWMPPTELGSYIFSYFSRFARTARPSGSFSHNLHFEA